MLLDRLKRKIQRLSSSKKSLDRNNERNKQAVKEQQAQRIREKQKEIHKVSPAVAPKLSDDKRKVVVAPLVLRVPQITEKAVALQDQNQYVFKVAKGSSKSEVKKAIKEVYGVDVLKVRIINVPAKKKRLGRTSGWQSGYKKAMVAIKKGQIIEILPR
ncbi:50S ribosomal protein L23 [bacterium (Candidatus Gribaldobacteria) CG08_land_8_20_14_0_20_39_15]|uniref:Large ribosomal subunit protein uL23 n=1 Tax=bacterium (Candidatus Gribaldobacteria) CG08_land_8_20_14_0_20_39_15 TaxID=2014273 RepID=A0A2M6XUW3_9BACT|nr:MAG: 50S ribosomal protein L23 [bacterium (Candidatus Gribaldobacteria) CG08_land_8_20_14_0_20_39_15]